jgi:hypothetical protein
VNDWGLQLANIFCSARIADFIQGTAARTTRSRDKDEVHIKLGTEPNFERGLYYRVSRKAHTRCFHCNICIGCDVCLFLE